MKHLRLFFVFLFTFALAACTPPAASLPQVADVAAGAAPPDGSHELMAAGVGAAAGYMAGRATAPQAPPMVMAHPAPSRTIIVNKTVIKQKTIVQVPRPTYRPSYPSSFGRRR